MLKDENIQLFNPNFSKEQCYIAFEKKTSHVRN